MALPLFIYGKNPVLSLAEILSHAAARGLPFRLVEHTDLFGCIEMPHLPPETISRLGGTLKIAEVVSVVDADTVEDALREMEQAADITALFRGVSRRTPVGLSIYAQTDSVDTAASFQRFLKEQAQRQGIQAGFVRLPGNQTALSPADVVRRRLIERSAELVLCRGARWYLGHTVQVHNPFAFRKRDLERPVQRPIFSISPRLSTIMLNLAGISRGIVLDPFCGLGSILQEAAVMGFDIRGLDSDRRCVAGCRRNMAWLAETYRLSLRDMDQKIRHGDARDLVRYFGKNAVDAIVAEPALGPPLRQRPGPAEARRLLNAIRPLYEQAMPALIEVLKPGRRLVIVFPSFREGEQLIGLDIRRLLRGVPASLTDPLASTGIPHPFPLHDAEERHRLVRSIVVIEKQGSQKQ